MRPKRFALRFSRAAVLRRDPAGPRGGRWLATVLLLFSCSVARAESASPGLSEAPLAPRSGPRGATMFTRMPAERTGINVVNTYGDPRIWAEREKEFALGAIGTGIAIGDYDGDGRPDIFVVTKCDGCRLYRNRGDWKFEDVTEKAGVSGSPPPGWTERAKSWVGFGGPRAASQAEWAQGATFVDVNNDGRLDIYVCRFGARNLLFINQGDGTFKEEAAARGLAVVDACGMAEFCDYDRDGWLDVYIHTTILNVVDHPNGQRDYLFHNQGDGRFVDVTARAGINGENIAHSATWWDFDEDGWPDLYVANDFAPLDRLYRNNGDGTFTDMLRRVVPHTPYSAMGADFGDVNNDGHIDLLVADMAATTHEQDQRGMASSREQNASSSVEAADIPQYPRNALYLNTGAGRFQEAAILAGLEATDWTWSVRFEDLDNDGRLDLHVTNGMVREYQNRDLRDRIVRSDSLEESRQIMKTSPSWPETHLAFRNLGDLRFENVSAAWGLDDKAVSFGAAFGDLDGDGDLDLVYANFQGGVTVLRNDSDTGHRLIVALRGTRSNRFGVGATVKIETVSGVQIRQLVLARGYLSSSEPVLHFGLGDDARIDRLTVTWPSGAMQTFTNLAVDRRLTLTEPEQGGGASLARAGSTQTEFEEFGQTLGLPADVAEKRAEELDRQPLVPLRFGRLGPALVAADLRGTGKLDWIVGGAGRPARVLRQEGPRYVASDAPWSHLGDALPDGPLLAFDADGDGCVDLLVTKSGTKLPLSSAEYQPRLFLNDREGNFRAAPAEALPDCRASVGALAAADFDRDGRLDVFVGARVLPGKYPLAPRSALLANRDGRFEDVTDQVAPGLREVGMVTSALWTDVDRDGWIDLLVATDWGTVKYFHNTRGHLEDWSERAEFAAPGGGAWTSLAAADFNGDGQMDYVVGNAGLNTPYRASPDAPALLYYGVFGRSSSPLVVEAYVEAGRLYPRRTRDVLGAKIPSILQRYPRNDDFARATLPELLGADALAAARRWTATEFRSGVFLSQPDGTYRFQPLPRVAQVAPLQGIVAGDFDGDGNADIYAVQNSSAPIPSVGRFDGGLSQLLRGDGRGNFVAVSPAESGLIVPGDAKALAVFDADEDGWPDFLVTRNGDSLLAFRNRGVARRHALQVQLRGRPGNPAGIGARVTLTLARGAKQIGELYAGSGYYSQSAPSCFFGYEEGNAPTEIEVCWPSGTVTRQVVARSAPRLVIEAPAP